MPDLHRATVGRKEFRQRAEAFLDVLTGEMRWIYELYDEGKSQHEIASIIGTISDRFMGDLTYSTLQAWHISAKGIPLRILFVVCNYLYEAFRSSRLILGLR